MKHRALSAMVLALIMCLGLALPALAAEENDYASQNETVSLFPDTDEMDGIVEAVRMLMAGDRKVGYNKTAVEIGERISVYAYQNGEFVEDAAAVYPVFSQDSLYTLLVGGTGADKNSFGYMGELVEPMQEVIGRNDEFALIFDKNHCYLYDGLQWHLLRNYISGFADNDVLDLQSDIDTSNIVTRSMQKSYSIGELNAISSGTAYISLPMVSVGQDASDICWLLVLLLL